MMSYLSKMTGTIFLGLSVALGGIAANASEDDWLIRATEESAEEPPRTIDSAEALDGGGGLTAPQRQTERKKPPEPDYLVGKVIWGESATFTDPQHGQMEIDDWNLVPDDVAVMTGQGRDVGGQDYHWANVHLDEFTYDPDRMPVLFFSGVRSLRLSNSHMEALRSYVLDGGTIILDSVYGSPHFTHSARETFLDMFPGESFRVIPADHPLLQTYYEIDEVHYPEENRRDHPHLEAIYIGARIGVLLSPYGIGTGLSGDTEVFEELRNRGLEPRYLCSESAQAIAANIVGYSVGYAEAGKIQGRPEKFGDEDRNLPSDQFVFAQIRHEGAWNTHPGAAAALMQQLRHESAIRVHMKRDAVDLAGDNLAPYTFLYLTGLDTFEFSQQERNNLRRFIQNGGFLLVNNGLGLSRFHQAVTRELQSLFPESSLERLDPGHEIFKLLVPSAEVQYTNVVRRNNPKVGNTPELYGIEHNGHTAVVYSPYDLEAGWLNTDFPLMRGYENRSAQRLGMNIIAYSMMR